MLTAQSFFDLSDFFHSKLFPENDYIWSGLNNLKEYMDAQIYISYYSPLIIEGTPLHKSVILWNNSIVDAEPFTIHYGDTTKGKLEVFQDGKKLEGASVIMAGAILMGNQLDIGKGVLVESGAMIKSPTIIGDCTEVRQGAYLRGYCLSGKYCVIGHTTEVKHSIFLDHAKAGHFAYLGDSILGRNANLGAGTKFANLKFLRGNVVFRVEGKLLDTGRRKFGAILGDDVQTGCNSVTSPGTLLGKGSMVMPNTTVKPGYHPEKSIIR